MDLTSRRKYGDEAIESPIASLDVSIALSRPRISAQQLLISLSAIACEALPVNVELACSSKVPKYGDHADHAAAVSCRQSIDGIPTRNTRLTYFLAADGEVTDFSIRLIDPSEVLLKRSLWMDSAKAQALADRNFLRFYGSKDAPRRQVIREERWYDHRGPVIDLHHRVCGVSAVHATSGAVTYRCDEPIPAPVWAPRRRREAINQAGPLTPGFFAFDALELSKRRTLLWGRSDYEYSHPGDERHEPERDGSVLYSIDAQGNVVWEQRFPEAAQLHVNTNDGSIAVLAIDRSQTHTDQLIVSRWTHEGHLLDKRAPISAPPGVLAVLLKDGGVITSWSEFDQSFVRRYGAQGSVLWTYELERVTGVRQLVSNEREAGVTMLVHRGDPYQSEGFGVLQLSQDGKRRTRFSLTIDRLFRPELLHASTDRVFVKGGDWNRPGAQRGFYVSAWDSRTGDRISSIPFEDTTLVSVTNQQTVLFSYEEHQASVVGERNSNGDLLWQRLVGAGEAPLRLLAPRRLDSRRVLVLGGPFPDAPTRQSTVMLLKLQPARRTGAADSCRPLERHPIYRLQPPDNPRLTVRKSPTFAILRPTCPADAQRLFERAAQTVIDVMANQGLTSLGQQDILVEIGEHRDPVILPVVSERFEDRQIALIERAGALRISVSPEALSELTDIMDSAVLPHLRRMEDLRTAIYERIGMVVMIEYASEDTEQALADAETSLQRIYDWVEGLPIQQSYRGGWENRGAEAARYIPAVTLFHGELVPTHPNHFSLGATAGLPTPPFEELSPVELLAMSRALRSYLERYYAD